MTRKRRLTAGALALAALGLTLVPALGAPLSPVLTRCPPCLRVANLFIRADVGPSGVWVMGTTQGDPDTPLDDDKGLLYGFMPGGASNVGSGFTTLRVVGPAGTADEVPVSAASQADRGDRVETVWLGRQIHPVRVTETLRAVANPYSGRPDAIGLRYDLENEDTVTVALGVRALLDVRIGDNDGAPYIVPGVGAVTQERAFAGDAVPPFWLAFESPVFDPSQLRGLGLLSGEGLDRPDRVLIARWPLIQGTDWDYPVEPSMPVTSDSAVALYWDPVPVGPGRTRSIQTLYGLAGNRGGAAFLTTPLTVDCGETFVAAMFINNFEPAPLTGGSATVILPAGLSLAPGEPATKPVGAIQPGGTGSVSWSLRLGAQVQGPLEIQAEAVFDGGRRFEARSALDASCVPPTATPSRTPSPTATATATPTATRTARPTATPTPFGTPDELARACPFLLGRVPPVAIAAALANPQRVFGWQEPLNPGLPVSPTNPRKTWLSIQNIASPYHTLFNALVFKVGCP
jgi:hypothetical protein